MKNTPTLTIFESKENQLKASPEELEFFKQFPLEKYPIHHVPFLGSFFLDQRTDCIKDVLRRGLIWEPKTKALIKKYAKPDSIAIDIGAHIGTHTITLSQCAGHVYAFEPQKKLYSELMMNLKLNHCSNITAYRAVLGNSSKTVQMNKATFENEGATEIGSGGDTVPMISLDDLLLEPVSFIKIDVESTEKAVLEGARHTILRNRPVILIEILENLQNGSENKEDHLNQIIELLIELKYIIKPFTGCDYLAIPIESACEALGWSYE